jgi:hypothetical protein
VHRQEHVVEAHCQKLSAVSRIHVVGINCRGRTRSRGSIGRGRRQITGGRNPGRGRRSREESATNGRTSRATWRSRTGMTGRGVHPARSRIHDGTTRTGRSRGRVRTRGCETHRMYVRRWRVAGDFVLFYQSCLVRRVRMLEIGEARGC